MIVNEGRLLIVGADFSLTIFPPVVLVRVFVATVVEHLDAVLIPACPVKPVIQLNKHREVVAIVFSVSVL